ncbi:tRNA:m(4)X modification enzyme TRM13 homolog [Phlebotomus argentipes]|uniref:tRNA:m(4)X modification enzyme TRM13 homolog n=1 Tax=Phlebotomus argentipes TaxID=94469 RepID=UPI0028929F47|nr:tRNA:m(4)X modification enzyme TRM13 homolog [Phlebotomus argentipes]
MSEPEEKRRKLREECNESRCQFFVIRKKRFCKMTVDKGGKFCSQHQPITQPNEKEMGNSGAERVPCPFDSKHTVYAFKLTKHLKICNARPMKNENYIKIGLHLGSEDEEGGDDVGRNVKLSELTSTYLKNLTKKINGLYSKYINDSIKCVFREHKLLEEELAKPEYGPTALKHLRQTASLLGCLQEYNLLLPQTCFVEFGAGKGQVSFWIAQAIKHFKQCSVVLVDKASHRHKKDNKVEDRDTVTRIRADIANLDLSWMPHKSESVVGVSKHLCGAATDMTLRCIVAGNQPPKEPNRKACRTKGILIALCCHHRCEWKSFVGKQFFTQHEITRKDFIVMTKMVSWAVCGTGMSRERRKQLEEAEDSDDSVEESSDEEEDTVKMSRKEKQELGIRCKRILDYARLVYLRQNHYDASLIYYVSRDVTLENVCIVATHESNKVTPI